MATINDRLVEAMRENGVTIYELSKRSGINKGTISKYVNGVVEPKTSAIIAIADALHVAPAWLLGFDPLTSPKSDPIAFEIALLSEENQNRVKEYVKLLIESERNHGNT